jgi:hypothetical protein
MKTLGQYILDGKLAVPCDELLQWGEWMETADRHVANDWIGNTHVSTVFLGLDHQHDDGEPLLFETMVFGGPLDGGCRRYSFWADAERGHSAIVAEVRALSSNA